MFIVILGDTQIVYVQYHGPITLDILHDDKELSASEMFILVTTKVRVLHNKTRPLHIKLDLAKCFLMFCYLSRCVIQT